MSDMNAEVTGHRVAVNVLIRAAESAAARWTAPRAPGKWSPSQVVEHVARAIDESAKLVAGAPCQFPRLPGFLRPVARGLLFNRVVRTGKFPNAKTSRPFDPESGPETPADGRRRLEAASDRFEQACRGAAGRMLASETFGQVKAEDWVRFQALHALHHRKQIPA